MKKKNTFRIIFIVFFLLLMYLPPIMMMVYSFNSSKLDAEWTGFTLDWYSKMLKNSSLMDALKNSLILAVISCGASAAIGTLGAVGMAKTRLRSKGLVSGLAMLPLMTPEIIMGMAFLAFFSFLGLKFGMFTLVLAHIMFCVPYIFVVVRGRLSGLDASLTDAACDLGASPVRAFLDVTLPLIAPAVLSGTLLAFAMSLDDVVISFFVTGATTNTLPIKIYTQIKLGVTPEINALCTVLLFFTLVIVGLAFWLGRPRKTKEDQL